MRTLYLLVLFSIISIIGCDKEEINPATLLGEYEGVFESQDISKSLTKTGPVTLILHESGYECIGNPNMVPAGGMGTFVKKDDKLIFRSEAVWKHVNLNMVLQGTFTYEFDGEVLRLAKNEDDIVVNYILHRQ